MFIQSLRNFKNPGYLYLMVLTLLLRIVPLIQFTRSQEVIIFEPYIRSLLPITFGFLSTPWVNLSFAAVLVYLQAVLLNQILIKYNIFPKPSYIPATLYIVLSSLFTIFLTLQPVLIANFFMLWLMERLFNIYKSDKPILRAFDLGLIIAAGTFIYFPFFFILPIIWIGLVVYLPLTWRPWLSGLLGFLVLYFFVGVYFFLTNNMGRFLFIFKPLHFDNPTYLPIVGQELWILILVGIVLLMAVYFYRQNAPRSLILVRKSLQVLIALTILSGLGYYLQPVVLQNLGFTFALQTHHTLLHFLIWSAPLSVFLSYYFIFARRTWIYESVFITLLGSILYFQIITKI